jgi:hypothetical protein
VAVHSRRSCGATYRARLKMSCNEKRSGGIYKK